jgi:hypothetical protein
MGTIKLVLFTIGTLALFVNVYLAVQNPELIEGPMGEEEKPEGTEHPLKRFDSTITYVMWTSWGLTALLFYLDKHGLMDFLDL